MVWSHKTGQIKSASAVKQMLIQSVEKNVKK